METRHAQHHHTQGVSRRHLLQAGLAAGATLATWPLYHPTSSWGAEAGTPKRGGILHVRGWDLSHFDPHLTRAFMTHTALSFVYNKLLRHKVGPDVPREPRLIQPITRTRSWRDAARGRVTHADTVSNSTTCAAFEPP